MIEKINRVNNIQPVKKAVKQLKKQSSPAVKHTLYDKVFDELSQRQFADIQALNSALVSKVLSYSFGEKATQETKYKALYSKVENALAEDENAQKLLKELKTKLQLKK